MIRRFAIPLTTLLASLPPCALAAQGWWVQAAAGRAVSDPVSSRVSGAVASLGVEYGDSATARWLYAQAGTPLGGDGPAWGAAGAGTWLGVDRGEFTAGASLGAHVFGYGAADSVRSGGGVTLEALPTLTWARGVLRGELASGVIYNTGVGVDSGRSRAVGESSARLIATAAEGVELTAEGRFLHAGDGDWPYLGAAAQVERGRYGGWAYAGEWAGADFPSPRLAYGVGGSVRCGDARLEVGIRQEPMDPVYLSTPRRTWTVQVSHRIGRAPRPAGPAAPAYLPALANGLAVFRLPRKDYPEAPSVIGDFTAWKPVAMTAEGDEWTASVRLDSGAHHYGFRAADGTFFTPPGVPAVDDGFGGTSAVLVVP
ncbi:glycogen-binding domain-containing protein [Longimicrobium sp.]|uniref:glycogen-binding domain-containing protein n=1 Tax=Longimicrobium sp. TaxID=2029185 RepID=UPI002C629A32|nr:glycogen-binding domain-containing protein [Longimicrobium sp.]HSU17832.1 glycogen-binding domain-containing protein [Longimicrobium sp.]